MIMLNIRSARRPNPWYASALARCVSTRRAQLGLTVEEAAELSGMEVSEWMALEAGWVPTDDRVRRVIAGTLEVNTAQIVIIATIAQHHQERIA
jgi:predicted transcriptional regulator